MSLADPQTTSARAVAGDRPMTAADAAFAAALHEKALPHGFFGRLGVRCLTADYLSFCNSPHVVAFVAETADGPAGSLVGTLCTGSHYSCVLRNQGVMLTRGGLVALLARPAERMFFLRTRLGRYLAGLLRFWRRTHGGALVEAFVESARRTECRDACLVTLADERGAGAFYRGLGWQLQGVREDRDGQMLESYCRQL